jgi:hypothetical protein
MNIPADCVYEWMADMFPSCIIYRFYPFGSKEASHLRTLDDRWDVKFDRPTLQENIKDLDLHLKMVMIACHDQEPLDYNKYQQEWTKIRQNCISNIPKSNREFHDNIEYYDYLSHRNFMALTNYNYNDKIILLHSEKRSSQIENYRSMTIPVFWWSHAILARDWYRFAEYDQRLGIDNNYEFSKDFNVYARAWTGTREYRLCFLSMMLDHDLIDKSRISFNQLDGNEHFSNHQFKNTRFYVKSLLADLPDSNVSSDHSAVYDHRHYKNCGIDVVLETLFDDSRLHLTEKILRPIACSKPFILAASHGSIQFLKEYGFLSFGDYINESYDTIDDPIKRLSAIVSEMYRITNLSKIEKTKLMRQCHRLAIKNKKQFFSQKFFRQVTDELKDNVLQAQKEISTNHQSGKLFFERVEKIWNKKLDFNNLGPNFMTNHRHRSQNLLNFYLGMLDGTIPGIIK